MPKKTIVIANHKGGCAKTTTALNLAVVLVSQGVAKCRHAILSNDSK